MPARPYDTVQLSGEGWWSWSLERLLAVPCGRWWGGRCGPRSQVRCRRHRRTSPRSTSGGTGLTRIGQDHVEQLGRRLDELEGLEPVFRLMDGVAGRVEQAHRHQAHAWLIVHDHHLASGRARVESGLRPRPRSAPHQYYWMGALRGSSAVFTYVISNGPVLRISTMVLPLART
jgi:hypothetical protein